MKYVITMAANTKHPVYHTEVCPYAKRIRYKNKMILADNSPDFNNYRPCVCCMSDDRYLRFWANDMKNVHKTVGVKQIGNYALYVKTNAGFWKIHVDENKQFVLFHRNKYDQDMTMKELIVGDYHRQKDVSRTYSLDKIFRYIKEHDKAKLIMDEDYRKLPTKTKKQKKYYKSAERRDKRKQVRNVFSLFDQLEADNPELKKECFV